MIDGPPDPLGGERIVCANYAKLGHGVQRQLNGAARAIEYAHDGFAAVDLQSVAA